MKKKIKNFARQHWWDITKAVLLTIITILAYEYCHHLATIERGYEAIGGEIFAFCIPFVVWVAPKMKGCLKCGDEQ